MRPGPRAARSTPSALEASGVFHEVRRLSDDLVFLQLTDDPADALRPDFDTLLDPVRRVLAPILSQPQPDEATGADASTPGDSDAVA
jgi:hypothetical protein